MNGSLYIHINFISVQMSPSMKEIALFNHMKWKSKDDVAVGIKSWDVKPGNLMYL